MVQLEKNHRRSSYEIFFARFKILFLKQQLMCLCNVSSYLASKNICKCYFIFMASSLTKYHADVLIEVMECFRITHMFNKVLVFTECCQVYCDFI